MAHPFTYAGAPWLTQYWVRRVKDEAYGGTTPSAGYTVDEDQGQMGGLGVLMAMGLFDVTGGASTEPRYEITSPIEPVSLLREASASIRFHSADARPHRR